MSNLIKNGIARLARLAAASGAALVGFVQDAAGAVYRTVQQELRSTLDVAQFGAVSGGTVNASAAFQAALNAAQGRRLRANGVYLLSDQVNISDNTILDLSKAKIIVGSTGHCIKAIGKKGITVIGGSFEPHPSIVTGVHPTGTYGASDALYFEGCEDCHVTQGHFTGFYGPVNFYNCSKCTAWENTLTDNAGGIQLLASDSFTGDYNCRGVSFHDNVILHSGDDALSFLCGPQFGVGANGSISLSSIKNNYISKDANTGGKNSVGLARGIALIGAATTTANTINYCVVSGNRGYYMGDEFVRAVGVKSCSITDNKVMEFSRAVTSQAFTIGDTDAAAYKAIDCDVSGNHAISAAANAKAFQFDGAENCTVSNNLGRVTAPGEGAYRLDNSNGNTLSGNTAVNPSGFGIDIQATSGGNEVFGGSVVGSTVGLRDTGATNYKHDIQGWTSKKRGQAAITGAATSTTVSHQISDLVSTARLAVRITPISPLYAASEWYVLNKTATTFDIILDVAPGGANVSYFEWEAWEARD